MEADDQCKRCSRLSRSFFGKNLSDIVDEMTDLQKGDAMKGKWKEADDTLTSLETEGALTAWPRDMNVMTMKRTGWRMETKYGFLSTAEFLKKFAFEPKVLGIRVVALKNEEGTRQISGCLFRLTDGQDAYYRVVIFFSETVWILKEDVLKPEDRSAGLLNVTMVL
jgi:hypothetical protein